MANYLPQLSPTGDCCNCNERNSPCDNCGNISGACCNVANVCYITTLEDCQSVNGIYLGNNTNCTGVDCTCCPFFEFYDTIRFSGSISGGGCDFTFPEKVWTKDSGALDPYEFQIQAGPCHFVAQDCNPFVDGSFVRVVDDDTSPCVAFSAALVADFAVSSGGRCGPFVQFSGFNTLSGCTGAGTNDSTEYDLSSGALTVVIPDLLSGSILYTFNISVE